MKKLALFALLLGSSFLYGCGEPAKKDPKKEGDKPAAGKTDDTTKPADGTEKPADSTEKPADAK